MNVESGSFGSSGLGNVKLACCLMDSGSGSIQGAFTITVLGGSGGGGALHFLQQPLVPITDAAKNIVDIVSHSISITAFRQFLMSDDESIRRSLERFFRSG